MGTAISRTATFGVAALAIAAAGCGATTANKSGGPTTSAASGQTRLARGTFAWLRPERAPLGWRSARIANGAVLRYPPEWRSVAGDAGTATAALETAQHEFLGYLNLTPRQANEKLSTWASFRIRHNTREGERGVKKLAAATGLRFRDGHISCVRDAYTTSTRNRFIELACLVQGRKAASVIVGAAPPGTWPRFAPVIEQAVTAVAT